MEHAADLPITGADYSGLSELVQKLYSSDVPSRDLLTFGLRCWSPPEATSQPGSRWMAFPPLPHETGAVLWVSQSRYSLLGQPQAGSRLTSSFAPYVGGEVDILLLQAHGNSQNFILIFNYCQPASFTSRPHRMPEQCSVCSWGGQ